MILRTVRAALILFATLPVTASAQTLTMDAVTPEMREGSDTTGRLLIRLDRPAENAFSGQVRLEGTGATAGVDFAPTVVPFSFVAGEISKTVTFSILDDIEDEPYREILLATVENITPMGTSDMPGVINAAASVPLTILDDDEHLTVTASGGAEGGVAEITVRQEFDSELPVFITATPQDGSATPGADFAAARVYGHLPAGRTETTLLIPLYEDDLREGAESFGVSMGHDGPGTAIFDPRDVTLRITDTTRPAEPVMIEHGGGVVKIFSEGSLVHQQAFQYRSMKGTLRKHIGGTRMTLSQATGHDLALSRFCARGMDFAAIAGDLPGQSPEDIGAGDDAGWKGAFSVDEIEFDYVLFERPDGSYQGFGRQQGSVGGGGSVLTLHSVKVAPLDPPKPEVPRLPPDALEMQLPLSAAADAVARELAKEFGMSPEALRPYISATPGPDMTTGDGPSARPVDVQIWLDGEGRPLRADRTAPGPCDPEYGKAEPALSRLRYRFHTAADLIVAQGAVVDVETGKIESAYMEDFDTATGGLDEAAGRAHGGLAADLAAPE